MNDIWLVRHGATEWSEAGRHTGRTDIGLTDAGRAGAALLRSALAAPSFTVVLTSPLSRARDTAALAGFPDAEVDDDLLERDYGDVEGHTTPEMRAQHSGWNVWDGPVPNGESLDEMAARARRVIDRADAGNGPVLVFAHSHILRVLTAVALTLPPSAAQRFTLQPTTISVVGWEHDYRALRRWNAPPSESTSASASESEPPSAPHTA